MPKYKTTYYTTNGVFSLDVEGDADIEQVQKNLTESMFRADYFILTSPSSPESTESRIRTVVVREHLVAFQIEEEKEL